VRPVPWPCPPAHSSGCCAPPSLGRTPSATSTGWCRSIPRSSAPTSMSPAPETGAPSPALGCSRGRQVPGSHSATRGLSGVRRPLSAIVRRFC
jgi:hypothetical protein